MMDSVSSISSPKSISSIRNFDFESDEAVHYTEILEKNLFQHAKLVKDIIIKQNIQSFSEDSASEIKSSACLEKLIREIVELYKKIKVTENLRKNEVSKILINELLEHELNQKFSEIVREYDERIQEMKFYIDRKDKIIYDLQKTYSELETECAYKQNYEEIMIVPLNTEILGMHAKIEDIRENILNMGENLNFGYNYKTYLIEFYRKIWRKTHILQALLRSPVNVKEGCGKLVRLTIPSEEPELTLEFEESFIEQNHFRAQTLNNDSFSEVINHRNNLSSGKDLILAVKSKLNAKIEKTEKKLTVLKNQFQKLAEKLFKTGEKNFGLLHENHSLALEYKNSATQAFLK